MVHSVLLHWKSVLVPALSMLLAFTAACAPATPAATPVATSPVTPAPTTPAAAQYSVMTSTKTGVRTYLVDGKGMTLYYFTKDSPGKSSATDAVLKNWPVFFTPALTVPSLLKAADFGSIKRDDASSQSTFRNWPLYYYVNDKAPGDTLGQGLNNVWYVIDPNNFSPVIATPTPTPTVSSGGY